MTCWFSKIARPIFVVLLSVAALLPFDTAMATPSADLTIYDDNLAAGWEDWSWSATIEFQSTAQVQSGSRAIAIDYQSGWAGFSLRTPSAIDPSSYSAVSFRVHGGASGSRALRLYIQESDGDGSHPFYEFTAPAGIWTEVTVPWVDLGNPVSIARINLQDSSGSAQPVFYVDDLHLVADDGGDNGGSEPITGTVQIDATAAGTAIDARLFGANLPAWLGPGNFADSTFRERTIASGVSVLRLPGGSWSNEYGWLSCEMGAGQANAQPCGADNSWASWAARPTDFLDFLQATGIDGMWIVNPNGTAQEAAAVVAFFNAATGDTTSIGMDRNGFDWGTAGQWAQLRSDNGNPDPLGIQLWSVGNEIYAGQPGTAQTGNAKCLSYGWEPFWTCDGGDYVDGISGQDGYLDFRSAMLAVDPTIEIGAVGVPGSEFPTWDDEVFAAATTNMEFFDIHQYAYFNAPAGYADVLAQPQSVWSGIVNYVKTSMQNNAGVDDIPIGVTEYNLFSVHDQDSGQWMNRAVNALFIADTLGQMAEHDIALGNHWDLANGPSGSTGSEYGLMHVNNNWYRSPTYYVFPLWAKFGTKLLPVTSTLDASSELSLYAGRIDADTYTLLAINKTDVEITATISINDIAGPLSIAGGTVDTAAAANLNATAMTFNGVATPANDLSDAPSTVIPEPNSVAAAQNGAIDAAYALETVLQPTSVTLLTLDTQSNPLPVPLGWVSSNQEDDGVRFEWQAITETNLAGYNILVQVDGSQTRVNDSLIPAQAIDSVEPAIYQYMAAIESNQFYIELVHLSGASEQYGPFEVNQNYGVPTVPVEEPSVYLPFVVDR